MRGGGDEADHRVAVTTMPLSAHLDFSSALGAPDSHEALPSVPLRSLLYLLLASILIQSFSLPS
jgi:hypothetical protein